MHRSANAPSRSRREPGGGRRAGRAAAAAAALLALLSLPAMAGGRSGHPDAALARTAASTAARPPLRPASDEAAWRRLPAARAAGARRRAASARDQAPARAPITVTVGGLTARWQTLPNTVVTATLRGGGKVKAEGGAQTDANGRVLLQLFGVRGDARISAGDTLLFKANGLDDVWSVTIPPLAVDVDASADRVIGRAAPGAEVALLVRLQGAGLLDFFGRTFDPARDLAGVPVPPTIERRAAAGADGALAFDLTGDVDLSPGDAAALVETDAAGDAFVAIGAATQALVRVGAEWGVAFATLGTTVTLDVTQPDGQRRLVLQGVASEVDGSASTAMAYLSPVGGDGGGRGVVNAPGPFGGGGGGGETGGPPMVGDRVAIRRDGGLLAPPIVTATLPALAVDGLDRAGGVHGRAPAGAALAARLHGPFGERVDLDVAPAADGTFDERVATPLGPGWRAILVWSDPSGLATGVVGAVPQVRARVGSGALEGIGIPGRVVTATLRDGRGAPTGTFTGTVGEGGDFAIPLAHVDRSGPDAAARRLEPGTSVVVEFDDGDPVVVGIVDVSTVTDPDRETVAGQAPPGAEIVVTLERPSYVDEAGDAYGYAIDDHRPVTAGLDGRFSVDFGAAGAPGGPIDIEPPLWGEAVLVRPDGHFVTRPWAPLAIQAVLGDGWLAGFGPPGEAVGVTLRDADGAVVVRRTQDDRAMWGGDEPRWYLDITDPLGQSVPTAAGDRLEVQVAGQSAAVDLPAIEAVSHVAEDRVSGRTLADAPIDLEIWTPSGVNDRTRSTADGDGSFAFDLAARHVDVVYNAAIGLTVHVGRHRVRSHVDIPGLTIDLDTGNVFGSGEPDVDATLSVERGGRTIGRRDIRTDSYGWFDDAVPAADGSPLVPRPGDVIVLSTPRARYIEPRVAMPVPELTIDLPSSRDHIEGTYEPDGKLDVSLWSDGPAGQWPDETELQTGADGRWHYGWTNRAFKLSGGWTVNAQRTAPSGHQAFRTRVVPRLDLRLGGATACGQAMPLKPVRLTVRGGADGSAAATSRTNGRFQAAIAAADGRARPVRSGDRVSADLGGWNADLVVPPLDLAIDWANRRITGTTAASATLAIAGWRGECAADDDDTGLAWSRWSGAADATGRFEAPIPDDLRAPSEDGRFAVVVLTPDGHRVYEPLAVVHITAVPDTRDAHGTGLPGAPFTATLRGPDGALRGTTAGIVDGNGRWSLAMSDAAGGAVTMRDGDAISVGAGGDVGTLPIETLGFDFDARRGLQGNARPGRRVSVVLGLAARGRPAGDERWYDITADDRGGFAIDAPPPRARWTFADVRSIRATIEMPGGHRLESRLSIAPPAPPAIYLPIGAKR